MEQEIWKSIKNYKDYEVSSLGRIRSLKFNKKKILKLKRDGSGYLSIGLHNKGKVKFCNTHRLVAESFCKRDNIKENIVDHIDRNIENNSFLNLRWVTPSINYKNTNFIRINKKDLCPTCLNKFIPN